ncbi:MAG TPA: ABC transporter ATP-binding protein [Pirellulales bacterium]
MQNIVIQAADLTKSYRNGGEASLVLRGVHLSVARGECVFLVGPSGSGKTTLLSILGCVLSADTGQLDILGVDARQLSAAGQAHFRRERIGFVFQRFHLFNALTAVENVSVPLSLLNWPKARARERALELLQLVGLEERASYRVTRLSMGQRQRVAFARALAANPDLILADEPTASLDSESGLKAMHALKDLCHELQKTVIVVTHDPRIYSLADRILRLHDGRVVGDSRGLRRPVKRQEPGIGRQAAA